MGRITGWLLLLLWLCAIPSFALSPTLGSLDSQAAIEIQAQDRAEREALGLPKDSSNDLVSGLEFVHSPQYTGSDESWVRCDEWCSSQHDDAVIWQKTTQLTPQWFSTETALEQDPALDRGIGTYASQSFTGREWDEETGLYFYRARYYDPQVGRFTGEDPIAGTGQSAYAYVDNNPLNYVDPFGLAPYDPEYWRNRGGVGAWWNHYSTSDEDRDAMEGVASPSIEVLDAVSLMPTPLGGVIKAGRIGARFCPKSPSAIKQALKKVYELVGKLPKARKPGRFPWNKQVSPRGTGKKGIASTLLIPTSRQAIRRPGGTSIGGITLEVRKAVAA